MKPSFRVITGGSWPAGSAVVDGIITDPELLSDFHEAQRINKNADVLPCIGKYLSYLMTEDGRDRFIPEAVAAHIKT